jgi:MFS family permease
VPAWKDSQFVNTPTQAAAQERQSSPNGQLTTLGQAAVVVDAPLPGIPPPEPGRGDWGVPAPLWAVLVFTFINSFATGITFNGLAFITETSYGYSKVSNSLIYLGIGITYILGAVVTGPLLRRARAALPWLTARRVLGVLMVKAVLFSCIPLAAWYMLPAEARAGSAWAIWVFALLYSGLCGALWPIVESFLSGGRSGQRLRSAMSSWNICWSSALILSLVSLGPLKGPDIILALALGGCLHAISLLILVRFPAEPALHSEDHAASVPPSYRRLLAVHRILLPTTYVVIYAMAPLLPGLMRRLLEQVDLHASWAAPVASIWLGARVITFFVLGRWQGWHGRWVTATYGTACLIGGFAAAALAPEVLSGWAALVVGLLGLFAIGVGAASIYCGALYYVLEVGSAQVEAGGSHEALIGVGYTIGPLCVLLPSLLVETAVIAPGAEYPLIVVGVSLLVGVAMVWSVTASRRAI